MGTSHHDLNVEPCQRRYGEELSSSQYRPVTALVYRTTYEERETVRDDHKDHGCDRKCSHGVLNDLNDYFRMATP